MKQNGHMGYEEFCKALEKKQHIGFDFGERSRKELVGDISEILGEKAEYMKMPTCAYQIGNYTIAKDGLLTWSADTAVINLNRIIESKGSLLMKAIGAEKLPHEMTPEKIRFPWFHFSGNSEENTAYTQLITALVKMANASKRITAKERTVENEKYAFRCFLLRLGVIGDECKASRKILLKNLNGNSAFRDKK